MNNGLLDPVIVGFVFTPLAATPQPERRSALLQRTYRALGA